MLYFTKYAEQKFDLLNKHKVFITREQITDAIQTPEKVSRKGKYFFARKEGLKAVYQKNNDHIKIITFYPVKQEN